MNDLLHAINDAGLTPPAEIIPDGTLKRFASNGNPADLSGWYVAFPDGGGFGGCWRSFGDEIGFKVSPADFNTWTQERKTEYREQAARAKAQAEADRKTEREQAARKALWQWEHADPAPERHQYLTRKKIKPHGVKVSSTGQIIVPVMDPAGNIQSLQFIEADGGKKFLTGGKVSGGFFEIKGDGDTIYITEGFATAAAVSEATGSTVFVAFNAGNLGKAGEAIGRLHPGKKLVICADNDAKTPGNPGITKGKTASEIIGAGFVFPEFTEAELTANPKASDFNDLFILRGPEAVKKALTAPADPKPAGREPLTPQQTQVFKTLTSKPPAPEPLIMIYDRLCMKRGTVGVILAAGGTGKTFFEMRLAVMLAEGGSFGPLKAARPVSVLILLAEDDAETMNIRFWDITGGTFPEKLHAASVCGICGPLLEFQGGNLRESASFQWLAETIKNHPGLDVLLLDPKSRFFGGEENSNDHNTRFIQCLEKLAADFGLTVLFSHHVNKASKNNGVSAEMSRGGAALIDGVRWAAGMAEMTPETGKQYGIEDPQNYFSFEIVKTNYGVKSGKLWFRKDPDTGAPEFVNLDHEVLKAQADHLYFVLSNTHVKYSSYELKREKSGKAIFEEMAEMFPGFRRQQIGAVLDYGFRAGIFTETEGIPDSKGRAKRQINCV